MREIEKIKVRKVGVKTRSVWPPELAEMIELFVVTGVGIGRYPRKRANTVANMLSQVAYGNKYWIPKSKNAEVRSIDMPGLIDLANGTNYGKDSDTTVNLNRMFKRRERGGEEY